MHLFYVDPVILEYYFSYADEPRLTDEELDALTEARRKRKWYAKRAMKDLRYYLLPKHIQYVDLVCDGYGPEEISAAMGISRSAVWNKKNEIIGHLKTLKEKKKMKIRVRWLDEVFRDL